MHTRTLYVSTDKSTGSTYLFIKKTTIKPEIESKGDRLSFRIVTFHLAMDVSIPDILHDVSSSALNSFTSDGPVLTRPMTVKVTGHGLVGSLVFDAPAGFRLEAFVLDVFKDIRPSVSIYPTINDNRFIVTVKHAGPSTGQRPPDVVYIGTYLLA